MRDFDISPDGPLLAYSARQDNRRGDIVLTALDDVRARRLVHEGGTRPRFARGGRELFFASGGEDEAGQPRGRLMRVPVTLESAIVVGAPIEVLREVPGGPLITTHDVASDGERFLMWKPVAQSPDGRQRLVFVQNALKTLQQ